MHSYPNDVVFVKYYVKRGFPGDSVVKNSSANAGDPCSVPGRENSKPLQYSCQDNPMDRRAWQVIVHRVTVRQDDGDLAWMHMGHSWW